MAILDPRGLTLVSSDARVNTLYSRDSIFDGPVWIKHGGSGYLVFTDVPGNVIEKLDAKGSVSAYLKNIFRGRDPADAYEASAPGGPFRMVGANGMTLDHEGRLVYCAYSEGEIVRIEADGRRRVLARRFAGKRLNAPNDLVYRSDGSLYFTDSRKGTKRSDGAGVPYEGLYVLRAGKVILLSGSIDHPNGVAFSPDERYLYVTNTLQKNILRFEVRGDGIANEEIFTDMSGVDQAGAPDGIKVDRRGNVYSTGPGGVWVITPAGIHVATIRTPKEITNMAFGGDALRTLYMTSLGGLYSIRLKVGGR